MSPERAVAAPIPAQVIAAVDIGSNAIRMMVAEVLPDGSVEVLERLQQGIRLGQDSFRRGRLGGSTVQASIAIMRGYRRALEVYHPRHLRTVATSAIREADALDRAPHRTRADVSCRATR